MLKSAAIYNDNARINDDNGDDDDDDCKKVQMRASVVAAFPFAALFTLLNPLSNGRNGRGVGNGTPESSSTAGQQVADVHHGQGGRISI